LALLCLLTETEEQCFKRFFIGSLPHLSPQVFGVSGSLYRGLLSVETAAVFSEESQSIWFRKRRHKLFPLIRKLQPELTFRALSHLLIVFLGAILVASSLVSMWKENRFGWPLRGIIWFTIAIISSCAVIALLAGYVRKAKSLEKVSQRIEAVSLSNKNL